MIKYIFNNNNLSLIIIFSRRKIQIKKINNIVFLYFHPEKHKFFEYNNKNKQMIIFNIYQFNFKRVFFCLKLNKK